MLPFGCRAQSGWPFVEHIIPLSNFGEKKFFPLKLIGEMSQKQLKRANKSPKA